LGLPRSLKATVEKLSKKDGTRINQFGKRVEPPRPDDQFP
jgi:hypothetical protein